MGTLLSSAGFAIALAWHRGANWEIPGSAPGSALGGALGNRGALGGAPKVAQGNRVCSRECSCGVLLRVPILLNPPHWVLSGAPGFPDHLASTP